MTSDSRNLNEGKGVSELRNSEARTREVIVSLFPGTFASETLDEGTDTRAENQILILIVAISVVCVVAAVLIAQ